MFDQSSLPRSAELTLSGAEPGPAAAGHLCSRPPWTPRGSLSQPASPACRHAAQSGPLKCGPPTVHYLLNHSKDQLYKTWLKA